MILKYLDHNGKEVIVKGVTALRKGFTFMEYSLGRGIDVEIICDRFWIGVEEWDVPLVMNHINLEMD